MSLLSPCLRCAKSLRLSYTGLYPKTLALMPGEVRRTLFFAKGFAPRMRPPSTTAPLAQAPGYQPHRLIFLYVASLIPPSLGCVKSLRLSLTGLYPQTLALMSCEVKRALFRAEI